MPTLEQKDNGDYYIRSYAHSKGCMITWQVRGSGVTFLNRNGVYSGNTFSVTLLQDMIAANHVFTNGSGIRSGTPDKQNQSSITITNPIIKTPLKSIPIIKNSPPQTSIPQRDKDNGSPTTIVKRSNALVFRNNKNQWELQIAFPKQSNLVHEVKGLRPSGTLFKKYKEAISLKEAMSLKRNTSVQESIRLDEHAPMLLGHSYFMVFRSDCEPKPIPRTLTIYKLENVGVWEAWGIGLPMKRDDALDSWCAKLGHTLRHP